MSIPLQYLTRPTIEWIGGRLAPVFDVDFDENSTKVGFVRVELLWNVDNPLRFQRNFQFLEDVNTLLSFRYERLRSFCQTCGHLSHERQECPLGFDGDHPPPASDDDNDDDDDDSGNDVDGHEVPGQINLATNEVPNPEGDPDMSECTAEEVESQQGVKRKRECPPGDDPLDVDNVEEPWLSPHWSPRALGDFPTEEQFWRHAPMSEVQAEFDRMGAAHTLRKYQFIDNLLAESFTSFGPQSMLIQQLDVEDDEDSDHIILEWEERRDAGSCFEHIGASNPVYSLPEMTIESEYVCGGTSADLVVDKFQVGTKVVASEFFALQKISVDYADEELLAEASNPIDRGAVGPVPPPVQ